MDNQPAYLRGRGRGRGVGAPAQTGLGFGDNIGNTNWNYSHDASKDMNSQASSLGPVGSLRSGHSFAGNQASKLLSSWYVRGLNIDGMFYCVLFFLNYKMSLYN